MTALVKARNKVGISQFDLARQIGVTQASISRWEKNPRMITGRYLVRLSHILGITTDTLLEISTSVK